MWNVCIISNSKIKIINSTYRSHPFKHERMPLFGSDCSHILYVSHVNFQIHTFTHNNSLQWVDGSPYAFQNWYHPSEQTVYPSHHLELHRTDIRTYKVLTPEGDFPFFDPRLVQPQLAQGRLCAGVHVRPTLLLQWIMVPCDQAIPGASFVCERRSNSDELRSKKIGIFRANWECPNKNINIESSCLYAVNSLYSRNDYNVEEVCGRMNMSVFHFPPFLFYHDPQLSWVEWSPDNSFLVKLLISMTHRWYTKFPDSPENADIVVGAGPESSEKISAVGLRYSETNLVHVQVVSMINYSSSNRLALLLCNHSVLVTNSLCLHGHAVCQDGTCILSHYVCDGRPDCPDYSDEFDCNHVCSFSESFIGEHNCFTSCVSPECVCNELYFQCEMGGCVAWSRICNALADCPNGEDEKICFFLHNKVGNALFVNGFTERPSHKLEESYYKCINGSSISQVLVDDLVPDCPKQDDEDKYHAFLRNGSRAGFFTERILCKEPDATTCEKNYKGVCYPRHLYCVHTDISPKAKMTAVNTETCRNAAHLTNCMRHTCPSLFKCPHAYCVPMYSVCNGKVDCPNGEDEEDCHNISCPGYLLCRYDNVCVHPHDVWSGRVKCLVSIDDKALHGTGACPDPCKCLGNGVICTKGIKLDLQKLSQSTRILIITYTPFKLESLPWTGNITALLQLQLSFCNISSIARKHFRPFKFLLHLFLRNNFIPALPSSVFQPLSIVNDIDLGHNLISRLHPSAFKGPRRLQHLKLDFNNLAFIAPCTFDKLKSLVSLNLSKNYLKNLGDNVFCHLRASMKEFYIGGNHLVNVDKRILKSHLPYLLHLDTTPLQVCCFVPQVQHCFPKERFFFSTCRNLFGLSFRYGAIASGACVLCISICSVIWISQRIRGNSIDNYKMKSRNRNPSHILNLLLFIFHGLKGVHVIILGGIDFVFHDYYALYEEKWKSHPLCILLNMLSYTLVLVTVFLYLLISFIRMIACAFPFHISNISLTKIVWATVIFVSVTFSAGYLPYSGIDRLHINEKHLALGFGLVIPVAIHGQPLWSLLGYVLPLITILFMSCAFQIICIHALLKRPQELKESLTSLQKRRVSAVRCVVTMVLPLCCHIPLLILHIATALVMEIPPYVSVALTLFTLHVYSVVNTILYVVITPAFIDFSVRCLSCL